MSNIIAFTRCINNERLFTFKAPFLSPFPSLQEGIDICDEELNAAFGLGPMNGDEFTEISRATIEADLANFQGGFSSDFLIGLTANPGQEDNIADTSAFNFVEEDDEDIEGLEFFQGDIGEFPWASDEPDNSIANEDCVTLEFEAGNILDGRLHDVRCDSGFEGGICRTSCSTTELKVVLTDTLFTIVFEDEDSGTVTANQGVDRCTFVTDDFEFAMSLGPIRGEVEFDALTEQLKRSDEFREALSKNGEFKIAIDLRVPEAERVGRRFDRFNTSLFLFLDEDFNSEGLGFYHVEQGEFPWAEGEPDNRIDDEHCVHLVAELSEGSQDITFLISDESCGVRLADGILCRGQAKINDDIDDEEEEDDEEKGENPINEDNGNDLIILLLMVADGVLLFLAVGLLAERKHKLVKIMRNQSYLQ